MRKLMTIVSLMLLAPAVSQAKTLDELLVEKGVLTKAEAKGAMASGSSKVFYNDGSRFEFDNGFSAQLNTVIRTSYTFVDADDGGANTSSFNVDNARIIVSGSALHNEFTYKLETDFASSVDSDGASSPELLDAYIAWHPCDASYVKMGQFKTLISRQYNTDIYKLQFADRTIASDYFDLGRQNGVGAGWDLMDGKLAVNVAMYNGLSDGEGQNRGGTDTKHSGGVSVSWKAMGDIDAFSEGDVEYSDTGLTLGAAYLFDRGVRTIATDVTDEVDSHLVSVDATFKSKGFSLAGEFFYTSSEGDIMEEFQPTGWYVQAGYFVMEKKLEVAGRVSMVDYDDQGTAEDSLEAGASINYYWWAHHLKAQLGYDHMSDQNVLGTSEDTKTNRVTLRLTGWF